MFISAFVNSFHYFTSKKQIDKLYLQTMDFTAMDIRFKNRVVLLT